MIAEINLWMLPMWYVAFLLSLTCHEAAHAWVAWIGGDDTAYHGGQVSLNPLPHMMREPFGTVLIPLITFFMTGGSWMMGWASAPYDPMWESKHPKRASAMAAAGPAANLLLSGFAFIVLKLGVLRGWWSPGGTYSIDRLVTTQAEMGGVTEASARFFSILFVLNLLLFVFNLFPLPPLDGSSVLAGLWSPARRLRDRLRQSPFGAMLGILIAWQLFPYIFWPIFARVVRML